MTTLVIGLAWPYAEWGGAQTHLAALFAPLSDRHQVVAFVPRTPSPTLRSLLEESGITVVPTGVPTRSGVTSSVRSRLGRRITDVRAHRQMLRVIRAHGPAPDVFHVDIPLWNGTAAVHALLDRAPVVQTFHTPLPPPRRTLRDLLLRAKFRSVVARRGYRLHAATDATAASLRAWVGARPTIDVIGTVDLRSVAAAAEHSVDTTRLELDVPPERIVVGTLGQLIGRKGLDQLIDAGRRLVDDGLDLHILLGGDGDAAEDLRQRGAAQGLSDRLTLVSPDELGTTHAEQLRVLVALDVLVMPSRDEGLPLTLLEGLALQRPAVVADVGAIGDVFVNGEHLLLVPPEDVGALAAAIGRVVSDDDLGARLAAAGGERVRELFDPHHAARRHEGVLLDLVAPQGRPVRRPRFGIFARSGALLLLVVTALFAPQLADLTGMASEDRTRTVSSSVAAFTIVRPDVARPDGTNGPVWVVPGSNDRAVGAMADRYFTSDVDGDGRVDLASWRSNERGGGRFEVEVSGSGTAAVFDLGAADDLLLPLGDWNGDGTDDLAVYRPAIDGEPGAVLWIDVADRSKLHADAFGQPGDQPVPLDFDGDGRLDAAVRRTTASEQTEFWIRPSGGDAPVVLHVGRPDDHVAVGDYDGDGRDDLALIRGVGDDGDLMWYVTPADRGRPNAPITFGLGGDIPLVGDFDGDRRADLAVWRDGTFWYLRSSDGEIVSDNRGEPGDVPTAAAGVYGPGR